MSETETRGESWRTGVSYEDLRRVANLPFSPREVVALIRTEKEMVRIREKWQKYRETLVRYPHDIDGQHAALGDLFLALDELNSLLT